MVLSWCLTADVARRCVETNLLLLLLLQTVKPWKGTIREYKAHLAKKMGVNH